MLHVGSLKKVNAFTLNFIQTQFENTYKSSTALIRRKKCVLETFQGEQNVLPCI